MGKNHLVSKGSIWHHKKKSVSSSRRQGEPTTSRTENELPWTKEKRKGRGRGKRGGGGNMTEQKKGTPGKVRFSCSSAIHLSAQERLQNVTNAQPEHGQRKTRASRTSKTRKGEQGKTNERERWHEMKNTRKNIPRLRPVDLSLMT